MAILFQYILRGYSNIDMLAYQVRSPSPLIPKRVLAVLQHPSKGWQGQQYTDNKTDIWTHQLEQFYNQVILNPLYQN